MNPDRPRHEASRRSPQQSTSEERHEDEAAMSAAPKNPEAEPYDGTHDHIQPMIDEETLLQLVPLSRSTLHRLQKQGKFPKGVYVSENRKLYVRAEIARWQNAVDEFNPNRGRGKGRRRRASRDPA
jgi:predicted DNA-binding transcriptional regulator AlpA